MPFELQRLNQEEKEVNGDQPAPNSSKFRKLVLIVIKTNKVIERGIW